MKKSSVYTLIILSQIFAIIGTSCSANYHVRKAINKGYRCDTLQDTFVINSIDSIPYVLRDSIMWERVIVQKDTIVRYNRSYVPQTRLQTRIEYKLKRDTLRLIEKVEVVKCKTQRSKKTKANLWLFVIGFAAGFLARFLMKFAKYTI